MSIEAEYKHFTEEEAQQIRILTYTACGFSIVGSIFILTNHLLFPRLRSMAFEFVMMLALSDLLYNLAYLMKPTEMISAQWCTAQAFFITLAENAGYLWYFFIAFTIHKILLDAYRNVDQCKQLMQQLMQQYRRRAHLVSWSVALLLALLPLITTTPDNPNGTYEPSWTDPRPRAPLWCWIKSTDRISRGFRAFYWSMPSLLFLYLVYVYYQVWSLLRVFNLTKTMDVESERACKNLNKCSGWITKARLKFYPVIFFIQIVALWLDRGYEWYSNERCFSLCAMHITIKNFQGFLNAVIYSFTEVVYYEWSRCIRRRKATKATMASGYTLLFENEKTKFSWVHRSPEPFVTTTAVLQISPRDGEADF